MATERLPRSFVFYWILAGATGSLVVGSKYLLDGKHGQLITHSLGPVWMALDGVILGFASWLVLRKRVDRSYLWILAMVAGHCVTLALREMVMPLPVKSGMYALASAFFPWLVLRRWFRAAGWWFAVAIGVYSLNWVLGQIPWLHPSSYYFYLRSYPFWVKSVLFPLGVGLIFKVLFSGIEGVALLALSGLGEPQNRWSTQGVRRTAFGFAGVACVCLLGTYLASGYGIQPWKRSLRKARAMGVHSGEKAKVLYEEAIQQLEQEAIRDYRYGVALKELGEVVAFETGERGMKNPYYEKALRAFESSGDEYQKDRRAVVTYPQLLWIIAEASEEAGDHDRAESLYLRSIEVSDKMSGRMRAYPLGRSLGDTARFYVRRFNLPEAEKYYERGREAWRKATRHTSNEYLLELGRLYYAQRKLGQAKDVFEEVQSRVEEAVKRHGREAEDVSMVIDLADTYLALGEAKKAQPLYESLGAIYASPRWMHVVAMRTPVYLNYSMAYRRLGKKERADSWEEESRELWRREVVTDKIDPLRAAARREKRGNFKEAEQIYRCALALSDLTEEIAPGTIGKHRERYAALLTKLGRENEGRTISAE